MAIAQLIAAAVCVRDGCDDVLAVLEMIGHHSQVLLDPSVERRVIRVRRYWAMLLPVLLQTVGIVLGVFLLSLLVGLRAGLWRQEAIPSHMLQSPRFARRGRRRIGW